MVWNYGTEMSTKVTEFNPRSITAIPLNIWLAPDSPDQPGYDAVILLESGLVRFVQTTIAREHDLKMWALADLVIRFREN